MGVSVKGLVGVTARVVSVRRDQGPRPHAGHSRFQTTSGDLLQGTAESLSQDGSAFVIIYLRKGTNCQTDRRGRNLKSEKEQNEHQEEKEEVLHGGAADTHTAA